MKRSLSMYSLSAVGAVVLMLSACGKKEEPKVAATAPAPAAATGAGARRRHPHPIPQQ